MSTGAAIEARQARAAIKQQLPLWRAHLQIARPDHWIKNVFVLPGILVAFRMAEIHVGTRQVLAQIACGTLAICLVASSNYVINELMDADFDRWHPTKRLRPIPAGLANARLAYAQWIVLGTAGLALASLVSQKYLFVLGFLWAMGLIYNIPPMRSKDVPFIDVLSEAVNNPLRLLAGWYMAGAVAVPPASLLLSYWMVGCYFMAIKRFAECRELHHAERNAYRKSLALVSPENMLISIVFYGSTAMLFFGAFLMRYRLELIASFPFVALVMATYFSLGFKDDSAAQNPEKLYRDRALMASVILCTVVMITCIYVDLPWMHKMFTSTLPMFK